MMPATLTTKPVQDLREFRRTEKLMGNRFEFTVVTADPDEATRQLDVAVNEVRRIEALLTTYNEESEVSAINRMAGKAPIRVCDETYALIRRSTRISEITDGAFDITYGSVDKSLWNFDRNMKKLPDAAVAKQMVRLINYRNILLDDSKQTVMLKHEGMRIGFGGIGKGYAAERVRVLLKSRGVASGIVNASGDLTVWGTQANGELWTIGIANPDQASLPFSYLRLEEGAVATSGNYEKFVIIDGKRYSHTINPKTGLPVTGIKSVTIISPNAEIADAMATPVTIMGIRAGLQLVNQINHLECIIIDDDNRVFTSNKIHLQ